jgi:hypothetical protein
MKKIFSLVVIAALILGLTTPSFAARSSATKARTASIANGISYGVTLADTNGDCVSVNSQGNLEVTENGEKTIAVSYEGMAGGAADGQEALITSACSVYSITVTGVDAGDYAAIYDAASAPSGATEPKFDPKVDTANGTTQLTFPGGAKFDSGLYVYAADGDVITSVTYATE